MNVLVAALLIAYFLDRALAHRRPGDLRALGATLGAAILAPVPIGLVAGAISPQTLESVRFLAFAFGLTALGYMFAAGSWAVRFLAELTARSR